MDKQNVQVNSWQILNTPADNDSNDAAYEITTIVLEITSWFNEQEIFRNKHGQENPDRFL